MKLMSFQKWKEVLVLLALCLLLVGINAKANELGVTDSYALQSKPFHRALLFPGNGANAALFLGQLAAAEDAGYPVDLIVGTCGGSIAAAIANLYPSSAQRKEYIESREFYQILHSISVIPLSDLDFIGRLFAINANIKSKSNPHPKVPDLFSFQLLSIPDDNFNSFKQEIKTDGIHIIVVAARLDYDKAQVGKIINKDQKLYHETLITDPITGKFLTDMRGGVGERYPDSLVFSNLEVLDSMNLADAVQASIPDPYFIKPYYYNGNYYITGAIDLAPSFLLKNLADEVILPYAAPWDDIVEAPVVHSTFGYDAQRDIKTYVSGVADHWIDSSDVKQKLHTLTPNPQLRFDLNPLQLINPVSDYDQFLRDTRINWDYGYQRMKEALQKPAGAKSHIRRP